jgi:hypothetical protein
MAGGGPGGVGVKVGVEVGVKVGEDVAVGVSENTAVEIECTTVGVVVAVAVGGMGVAEGVAVITPPTSSIGRGKEGGDARRSI